jgi:phospholipase/carboxylesterase
MNDLIIQRPTHANALCLLFHGVGASAASLQGLGQQLAQWQPKAIVVSVQAPHPADFSGGWQWFSVQGVTPDNRAARAAAAMPAFLQAVSGWQQETGLTPAQTTLIGFSQGAIMSLAASQQAIAPAGRVVALAGRFPQPPQHAATGTQFHLLHGQADAVVPAQSSVDAQVQLQALGAAVTLDLLPGLGHGVDAAMLQRLQARLAAAATGA